MNTLFINIHYPSCRANKFYSEDFIKAIKEEFKDAKFTLEFGVHDYGDGIFPYGHSDIRYPSNTSDIDVKDISSRVESVFISLVEANRN
ncbi:TPA: hypothetical protein MD191_004239 [Klebsiella pneumoniae]|uniref:hypothetical protein n=1 Tax=Klebsiella pneumoniae TaxID=573 RepID=UPI000E2A6556|nr:hypothetical protein [Klebsiella pneumoniae]MBA1359497.1 hypothetical protein [Klebsiella pneumoniae]MBG2512073.1 hypothetical protein [Klebsiella pneumoniae]MBG2516215.1 hypothetical protein [Klebsiella pneumoniae]MBS4572919.1 hypothetical protein [Klebsiella pneumoniae]MBS4589612.1 hypothetical protein [Klebsiella pneumoniae]